MDLHDTPEALRGFVEITDPEARGASALRASGLPGAYTPKVAGYARGPFLDPQLVTPSEWRWRNTRTYIIQHSDGLDYRAVMVHSHGDFVGYWAVELLGLPLTLPEHKD